MTQIPLTLDDARIWYRLSRRHPRLSDFSQNADCNDYWRMFQLSQTQIGDQPWHYPTTFSRQKDMAVPPVIFSNELWMFLPWAEFDLI